MSAFCSIVRTVVFFVSVVLCVVNTVLLGYAVGVEEEEEELCVIVSVTVQHRKGSSVGRATRKGRTCGFWNE